MFKTGDRVESLADQAVGRVTEVDGSVIRVTFDDGSVDWFSAPKLQLRDTRDVPGNTRDCPDCGRPQHYTGTEYGWAHDAMTADQAHQFRYAYDQQAKALTRMSKADLAALRIGRLGREGIISYGGPSSKDELIRDLLERDYPIERLNESIHVLHHKPGETWSACEWCHPHEGATCECSHRARV